MGQNDAYIAAIAQVRGFAIATRDARPFLAAGLAVINPWESRSTGRGFGSTLFRVLRETLFQKAALGAILEQQQALALQTKRQHPQAQS